MRTILIFSAVILLAPIGTDPAAAATRYTVSVSTDLQRLDVRATFEPGASRIVARAGTAGRYLRDAADCGAGTPLGRRGRVLTLPAAGLDCLEYSVDLAAAARDERRNSTLDASNFVVSPAVWLWRPPLSDDDVIDIDIDAPDGIRVSVPWLPRDGSGTRFTLQASPENARALAAFGRYHYREIAIGASTLRIATLEPAGRSPEALFDWVADVAGQVLLVYGRFPHPSPQVLLLPVGGSERGRGAAVAFGRVVRDGGESIELLVNEHRPVGEYYDDWTATHEFSHLLLPYVRSSRRWLSEGFAQYYQNVLMARAGAYSSERAWQKLYEGFERGRRSRPDLSPNQAAEGSGRASTMKIYWSGAVLMLTADVELRRRSGGEESLDDVLDRLQRCCLPSSRTWGGRELMQRLDTLVDEPLFVALYDQYAGEPGFPDYGPLFERLGITLENGRIGFDDTAEAAAIRRSITVY